MTSDTVTEKMHELLKSEFPELNDTIERYGFGEMAQNGNRASEIWRYGLLTSVFTYLEQRATLTGPKPPAYGLLITQGREMGKALGIGFFHRMKFAKQVANLIEQLEINLQGRVEQGNTLNQHKLDTRFQDTNTQSQAELEKFRTLISLYLTTGLSMLQITNDLNNPGVKPACRLFILGIVDMIRQINHLNSSEFLSLLAVVLSDCKLEPPDTLEQFVKQVGQAAEKHPIIEQIMQEGANSIRSYIVDRDTGAPLDIGRVVLYAEKNSTGVINAVGNT